MHVSRRCGVRVGGESTLFPSKNYRAPEEEFHCAGRLRTVRQRVFSILVSGPSRARCAPNSGVCLFLRKEVGCVLFAYG